MNNISYLEPVSVLFHLNPPLTFFFEQTSAERAHGFGPRERKEGRLRRGSLLLVRRLVRLHGWACAHQVLVAVDVVDPGDARPEFGLGSDVRLQENKASKWDV